MALTHLADTSLLTRLSRPALADVVRLRIAPMLAERRVGRVAMSDLEVGFSARNEREWDAFASVLAVCPLVPLSDEHFHLALRTQRRLAASGLTGRKLPDLLIAAVAEAAGVIVLHYDSDFDLIAGVTGQAVEWAFPPGSVD